MKPAKMRCAQVLLATAVLVLAITAFGRGGEGTSQKAKRQIEPCEVRVYSDLKHIDESGDDVGTEIVLRQCRSKGESITGQWDEYEGYSPVITPLSGSLRNSKVRMAAPRASPKPQLEAELKKDRLEGTLKWYVDGTVQTKALNLRGVPGRWEDLRKERGRR
ncbi:MAG TPA: hypothetical protein VMZ52_18415 [Bryobacteraceae bacterium]|nr:hypothetical protein [Bryobacteraceae bacterium]